MSTDRIYHELRAAGESAVNAWRSAVVVAAFKSRECGEHDEPAPGVSDVRLRAEPEQDSYLAAFGEPDAYTNTQGRHVTAKEARAELVADLDRDGVHVVFSEAWDAERGAWVSGDCVGMCCYPDPLDYRQNQYIPDLMESALNLADVFNCDCVASAG